MNEELKLLSISKAANLLGIGTRALRSLIVRGKIKTIFIGKRQRVSLLSLREFVESARSVDLTPINITSELDKSYKTTTDEFFSIKKKEMKNGISL